MAWLLMRAGNLPAMLKKMWAPALERDWADATFNSDERRAHFKAFSDAFASHNPVPHGAKAGASFNAKDGGVELDLASKLISESTMHRPVYITDQGWGRKFSGGDKEEPACILKRTIEWWAPPVVSESYTLAEGEDMDRLLAEREIERSRNAKM
jgi:hypothetical protein